MGLVVVGTLLLLSPSVSQAQAVFPENNGVALAGVESVNARAFVTIWLDVDDDRERFQSSVQTAFELGLRRDGVIVDPLAPGYVVCLLRLIERFELVVYAIDVSYYALRTSGVHPLLWTNGGMFTIGTDNFTAQGVASICVDYFANEWLKQNPP